MILLVGVLPFLSTLLGGVAVLRFHHRLHVVMAAAAGILVATALVDLIPESIELIGTDQAPFMTGAAAVFGYLLFTAVEAFIHQGTYEHSHAPEQDPDQPHEHPAPPKPGASLLGWLAPAGLIVHSTIDGLVIGIGFAAGAEVGIIVLIAVIVHDFADGLNIVTLALAGGRGRTGAIVLLALDAAATIVGIAVSQLFVLAPETLGIVLGVLGGAFIAIGAGHLMPEAEHRHGTNPSPLIAMTVLGALVVVVTRALLG